MLDKVADCLSNYVLELLKDMKTFIFIIGTLVVVSGLVLVWNTLMKEPGSPPDYSENDQVLPSQEPSNLISDRTLPVETDTGTVMVRDVRDFPEATNRGYGFYELTDLLGDPQAPYALSYDSQNQVFSITIRTKPILDVRDQAVSDLQTLLDVSTAELCQLPVSITVLYRTDPSYIDQQLPLGVCQ